ncbi:MAG: hypothetical protein AAGE80_18225 [Pseudomonadota bacterium]
MKIAAACLLCLVFLAACAKPVPLAGEITQAEIILPNDDLVIVDWEGAVSIARQDGVFFISRPASSQKPTREEIQELKRIDENNSRYAEYFSRKDVLLRAQEAAIPALEKALVEVPARPFILGRSFPALNGSPTKPLKIVIKPRDRPGSFVLSRRDSSQMSSAKFAGKLTTGMLVGLLGAKLEAASYRGEYELVDLSSGAVIETDTINLNLTQKSNGLDDVQLPAAEYFARLLFAKIVEFE